MKPRDVKDVHQHHVQARCDGTCDWIASIDTFKKWIAPGCSTLRDRLLVVSGPHGCGKSVLASSVVVRLNRGQQLTLYFAFSSSDGNRQTNRSLVKTLLWQILHRVKDQQSLDIVQRLRRDGQPTLSQLWEAFGSVTSLLTKAVFCIIDGIDECTDLDHLTSTNIRKTLERCPNLRIQILGRTHIIQAYLSNLDHAKIDVTPALLKQDLETFVDEEIAKSSILSLPDFHRIIFQTLNAKSDGMFLWVRLMVDDLNKSSSKYELRDRLQALPCGLEEAYQTVSLRISQDLDNFERPLAQHTLAMMTVCCRPICFDEVRFAYAIRCRSLDAKAYPLEDYLLLTPAQRIVNKFEGLVSMLDGVLQFAHSSVRDFLTRPEDRWTQISDRALLDFRIDITQVHRSIAWLCLDYLISEREVD